MVFNLSPFFVLCLVPEKDAYLLVAKTIKITAFLYHIIIIANFKPKHNLLEHTKIIPSHNRLGIVLQIFFNL